MTETLEKALAQVVALTPDKQDTIGNIILEEIKDDELWDKQFKESQSQLSKIAAKVKSDIKAGKIQQKGFAEL
jgi:aspartate/glutamate racemase